MPPDGPHWDPHSVSTVDLWTFIVATSHYGETVTVLAMGKDAFGVNLTQFSKLDTQIRRRGIKVRLAICHDGQSQRSSGASLLGWTPSSNGHDKLYQEFDLTTLVSYQQGLPNGQDLRYVNFAQELIEKERRRQVVGTALASFASVNDRGRNRSL